MIIYPLTLCSLRLQVSPDIGERGGGAERWEGGRADGDKEEKNRWKGERGEGGGRGQGEGEEVPDRKVEEGEEKEEK